MKDIRAHPVLAQFLPVIVRYAYHRVGAIAQVNLDIPEIFVLLIGQFPDLGAEPVILDIVLNQNDPAIESITGLYAWQCVCREFSPTAILRFFCSASLLVSITERKPGASTQTGFSMKTCWPASTAAL